MRLSFSAAIILAGSFLAAAVPCFSQVAASATRNGVPLVVGAGFSNYNIDFGAGRRMNGGTVWADWYFRKLPLGIHGLGVEALARDISLTIPAGFSQMRYDTAEGGAIYHIPRLGTSKVRPYAKGLIGFGSIDFPAMGTYGHDTRTIYAFGGGADIHAWRYFSVRADYEYQLWYGLFGRGHALTPNGVTIGVQYDLGGER